MSTAKTAEEILAEAENPDYTRVESAYVLQRQDLLADYEQARAELAAAMRVHGDGIGSAELTALRERVDEAEAAVADALIEYRFRNIGHRAWADLLAKHPPTKEQIAQNRFADHNPDTFKPAALALACVEPKGATVAFFSRLAEVYAPDQFEALWLACYQANMGNAPSPKVLRLTRGRTPPPSEQSESTPVAEASPEASS